jgi:hypothetical protein
MLEHCLIAVELFANANRVTVLDIFGAREGWGGEARGPCWGGFGVLI